VPADRSHVMHIFQITFTHLFLGIILEGMTDMVNICKNQINSSTSHNRTIIQNTDCYQEKYDKYTNKPPKITNTT